MSQKSISLDALKRFQERYTQEGAPAAAAVARVGIQEATLNNEVLKKHLFVYSDETKIGEITNQKSSGRCWMFASLNVARVRIMEEFNLETFEFSQNYTFFWDKLEKSNFFLESILSTLDEPRDGRLIHHLLQDPVQDGGQWDMFSGILEKYGAVPKDIMPETFSSSNSRAMDEEITRRLRAFACRLRQGHKQGKSADELRGQKEEMLYHIYRILVHCLGEPPYKFEYSFRDKDKKFHRLPAMTPQEFFKKYVGWDLSKRVSLINCPTADKPYGKAYTVKFLGTVAEAPGIRYINVPIEVVKETAIRSIKAGQPVWFGCDVVKDLLRKEGIMDLDAYMLDESLGAYDRLDKAERVDYSDSVPCHAMVLAGVDLDENGKPLTWKVENSWSDKSGKKGIYSMTDDWFTEYTYQIMVDRSFVDEEWLKALDGEIVELDPWDPMGALARVK